MMKNLLILSAIFIFSLQSFYACIDPPNVVSVNIVLDPTDCEILVEVSNLRMMGGDPNQFCSCGINDQISNLGSIAYIAFVDSTTNTPVLGFEQFGLNALASSEWGSVESNYDWSGFVSLVNESGLIAGQSIKLWIRLDMYDEVTINGFTFDPCESPEILTESEFFSGAIGTDEWNDADGQLALDHMGIAYFYESEIGLTIVEQGGLNFYDDIINSFYLSLGELSPDGISIFPNPAKDILYLKTPDGDFQLSIYNAEGQLVLQSSSYNNSIDIREFNKGLYFLVLSGTKSDYSFRFVKE